MPHARTAIERTHEMCRFSTKKRATLCRGDFELKSEDMAVTMIRESSHSISRIGSPGRRRFAPEATTRWPGFKPLRIKTELPDSGPGRTRISLAYVEPAFCSTS